MYKNKVLSIVERKKEIVLEKEIQKDVVIIIDFFNIYCSIVKFNKYKTFSKETFILCMDLLLNKFKDYRVLIVSKNIFEIELEYIISVTKKNLNITYIIVEDTSLPKGTNRERDDFTCILLQNFLTNNKQDSIIISNDKYRNFYSLLNNTKIFKLHYYSKGNSNTIDINHSLIKKYSDNLKMCGSDNVLTTKFNLI